MTLPARITLASTGTGAAPRLLELSADALGEADRIGEMFTGALGGVLVTGAIPPALSEAVVSRLRTDPGGSGPVVSPLFPGWTYGAVLVVSEPDRVDYDRRGRALASVLAGLPLADRISALLSELSGGRPVAVPPEAQTPLTVRVIRAGDGVGIHSERADWPSMVSLSQRIDTTTQLSCYTPLLQSGGGQLHLYHRPPRGEEPAIEGRPEAEVAEVLAGFGLTVARPRVGDLLVFDGGRYNHRVLPARGGERWTAGAFLAPGRDGQRYAWS